MGVKYISTMVHTEWKANCFYKWSTT